jgi:hypothetical protein
MTFQSAPDCAEAVINAVEAGKPMANVLNFHRVGGYVQADIDNLAFLVDDWVGSDYLPLCTDDLTYLVTHVKGLESSADLEAFNAASTGLGGVSGSSMPLQCTLAIKLTTGFTGRSQRGRFYALPTGLSNQNGAAEFTSAYANALVTALQSLITATAAADWDLVVLSRYHLNAQRATAVFKVVTDVSYTDVRIDTQRRRIQA